MSMRRRTSGMRERRERWGRLAVPRVVPLARLAFALVRVHAEALCDGDELVAGGLEDVNGMGDDVVRSAR